MLLSICVGSLLTCINDLPETELFSRGFILGFFQQYLRGRDFAFLIFGVELRLLFGFQIILIELSFYITQGVFYINKEMY